MTNHISNKSFQSCIGNDSKGSFSTRSGQWNALIMLWILFAIVTVMVVPTAISSTRVPANEKNQEILAFVPSNVEEDVHVVPSSSSIPLFEDDSQEKTFGTSQAHKNTNDEVIVPHTGYKKVLVTGGAGFIGSHVAQFLLDRGDDVVIVDEMNDYYDVDIKKENLQLLRDRYSDDRLRIYYGDICDDKLMESIFEKERPGWVCHMAARAGVRYSIEDPQVYIHSNVEGTTKLLEWAVKYEVQNFVFASSSSVYGGTESELFSEDQVIDRPLSQYAATKKACELLSYTYHHLYDLNITALRFFTVYGPRGRPDMAPFKFIDYVSRGMTIQQYGDGSSMRDYTYIDDIIDGVVRALDRPYPFQIFNLGNGKGTTLKEFINLIEEYTGREANIEIIDEQPGDVPYTRADISKAQKYLGYDPHVSIQYGVELMVDWFQSEYGVDEMLQDD